MSRSSTFVHKTRPGGWTHRSATYIGQTEVAVAAERDFIARGLGSSKAPIRTAASGQSRIPETVVERLYRRHGSYIRRWARSFFRTACEAEAGITVAWLKILKQTDLGMLDDPSDEKVHVHGLVYDAFCGFIHSAEFLAGKRRLEPISPNVAKHFETLISLHRDDFTPSLLELHGETLLSAIALLPDRERTVVTTFLDDQPIGNLAQEWDCHQATVSKTLRRAIASLRRTLTGSRSAPDSTKTMTLIPGQRFGRLRVLEFAQSTKGKREYRCQCDCGQVITIAGVRLTSGGNRSCGCLRADFRRDPRKL